MNRSLLQCEVSPTLLKRISVPRCVNSLHKNVSERSPQHLVSVATSCDLDQRSKPLKARSLASEPTFFRNVHDIEYEVSNRRRPLYRPKPKMG